MHIAIVYNGVIPVKTYGGTARDIWYLGKELHNRGHQITYLVAPGSFCPFANVVHVNPGDCVNDKIPETTDIINSHQDIDVPPDKPVVFTIHGNTYDPEKTFHENSVFVSYNHARRFGSEAFVYNGMDWDQYPKPDLSCKRSGYHFLGKAAWKIKNLKAAIAIARRNKKPLEVMGGYRFNIKMGLRFTLDPRIRFHGMVMDDQKGRIMNRSEALLFPVLWHEPMGLAVIESLYYGCPVFATPYGSLPELVGKEFGFLSTSLNELTKAAANAPAYDTVKCHEYARDTFNASRMADKYLMYFEKILNGESLNNTKPQLQQQKPKKFLDFSRD